MQCFALPEELWQTLPMQEPEVACGEAIEAADVRQFVIDRVAGTESSAADRLGALQDYYQRWLINPMEDSLPRVLHAADVRELHMKGNVLSAVHFYQDIKSDAIAEPFPPRGKQRAFEVMGRMLSDNGAVIGFKSLEKPAREANLLESISLRVMHQGCELAHRASLPVSVNIPPGVLLAPDFEKQVSRALEICREERLLILELLENNRLLTEKTIDALRKLTARGIRLAVDDYGEETSQELFEQLASRHIPIDTMKFKGSRLKVIREPDEQEKLRCSLDRARHAGVKTIVWEGYERTPMGDIEYLRLLRHEFKNGPEWLFEGRAVENGSGGYVSNDT